jgi:hypothetical protein
VSRRTLYRFACSHSQARVFERSSTGVSETSDAGSPCGATPGSIPALFAKETSVGVARQTALSRRRPRPPPPAPRTVGRRLRMHRLRAPAFRSRGSRRLGPRPCSRLARATTNHKT